MDLESAAKIVFCIISAVIAHGLLYGTAQANWPSIAEETRTSDRIKSSIVCLAGPAAIASVLIVSLLMGRKIVFRLRANRIPERES